MNKQIIFGLFLLSLNLVEGRNEDVNHSWIDGGWIEEIKDVPAKGDLPREGFDALRDVAIEKGIEFLKDEFEDLLDSNMIIDLKKSESHEYESSFDEKISAFLNEKNKPDETPVLLNSDPLLQEPVPQLLSSRNPKGETISHELRKSNPIDYIQGASRSANGRFMKKSLESIAKGGAVQEYIISTERISPLVASAMKQVQTWANQLNTMSVMSNDLAALLGPGLLPKKERADAYLLDHALVASHPGSLDLVGARHYTAFGKVKGKKGIETQIFGDVDVADKIIEESEKKEILKAITGTVIVDKDGVGIIPSKFKKVIQLLNQGKDLPEGLSKWTETGVFKRLKKIQRKLKSNEELKEEKEFLNEVQLPIGQLLTLLTQYQGSGAEIALQRYARLISYNHALQFVEEEAEIILHQARSLLASQFAGFELKAFIDQIEEVIQGVIELKNEQHRKLAAEQQALETMMTIDRTLKEREKGL